MINEDFDMSGMSEIDWTDTFADADENAVKEKIQKFIDDYIYVTYIDKNWTSKRVTPLFNLTADKKIAICMPDGSPLPKGAALEIGSKTIQYFGGNASVEEQFDSIQQLLCGMQLADMPTINVKVKRMNIRHLYGMPESTADFIVQNCEYLEDLSGIPKKVFGYLQLHLLDSVHINIMPEIIAILFIGDNYFGLTKNVIDLLPYDIQYIKVSSLYTNGNSDVFDQYMRELCKHVVNNNIDIR